MTDTTDSIQRLNNEIIKNLSMMSSDLHNQTEKNETKKNTCRIAPIAKVEKRETANVEFIKDLTDYYLSTSGSKQVGGYSGKRTIKSHFSDNKNEISEYGMNDSFVINNKRKVIIEESSENLDSLNRPRRDPGAIEAYNALVKKIMDILGVDEETAKLYRLALKIDVVTKHPELAKFENDALKIKEIEKMVTDRETLQRAIDSIDIEGLKKSLEERRKQRPFRPPRRHQRRPGSSITRESDQAATSGESTATPEKTEQTSQDTTPEKPKRRTKKQKAVESGYLESSEIIFSQAD